jgi:hypothetical protein
MAEQAAEKESHPTAPGDQPEVADELEALKEELMQDPPEPKTQRSRNGNGLIAEWIRPGEEAAVAWRDFCEARMRPDDGDWLLVSLIGGLGALLCE